MLFRSGEEEKCTNKAWMDEWKQVEVCREGSVATTRQSTEIPILDHDSASHIADLAVKGSTAAIAAADDPVYDFYLLKVTSHGVELEEDYTDDYIWFLRIQWSACPKREFLFKRQHSRMTFTLDVDHTASVYAATVRRICRDLPTKKRSRKVIYKLPRKENEEIIASL